MIERFATWFWTRFGYTRSRRCMWCRRDLPDAGMRYCSERCRELEVENREYM